MDNASLFKISKKVYKEALLHAQLQAAGTSQAKFLEKIDKDRSMVAAQGVILKIMIALYISVLTLVPIRSFWIINQVAYGLDLSYLAISSDWAFFVGSMSVGGFLLLQPIILVVFSIVFAWGLVSGGPYHWIHTLPFDKDDVQKIGLFTFLRGTNIQMIFMVFVLPVGVAIGVNIPFGYGIGALQTVIITFVATIISLINAVFNLSIVVILGRKMAIIMEADVANDRNTNIIRIFTVIFYLLGSMTMMYFVQFAIDRIPILYQNEAMDVGVTSILNIVLSFIPFPFSQGYLLTYLAMGFSDVSYLTIIGSLVGFCIHVFLTYLLFQKALGTLRGITSTIPAQKREQEKDESEKILQITRTTPVRAFMKRDLAVISRDFQALMYLVMPIMIPILGIITDFDAGTEVPLHYGAYETTIFLTFYVCMLTYMLIVGITNIESGGETITSSLPISTRDQVISKVPYFFGTILVAYLSFFLFFIGQPAFLPFFTFGLLFLPVLPIIGIGGFFFKILLFGKMKHKYVIEEINMEYKAVKHIMAGIFVALLAAGFLAISVLGYLALVIAEVVGAILLFVIFNFMFPKQKAATLA